MGRAMSAAILACVLAPCVLAQAPMQSAPLVRVENITKVSSHVFVIPDNDVVAVSNIGIVVGSRAVLVIDTGLGVRNGKTVLGEVQRIAPGKALYVVATHAHPEHDLGATAFPANSKMIRSTDQSRDADLDLDVARMFAQRSPAMAELLKGASFRKADVSFEQEYVLDLGELRVRIVAMGPNHTPGDTAILIPEDAVLFGGDIAMTRLPVFSSPQSSLNHWLAALDTFEAMMPRIIVPSHGPIGDLAFVARARAYLTTVRDETVKAKQHGQSVEVAITSVSSLLRARYPDLLPLQMTPAIRSAYAEVR